MTTPSARKAQNSAAPPVGNEEREPGTLSWRDRLLSWRDRFVGDPQFQRWAAGFPLTRPVARRQAQALFDLCAGFVYSQVLAAVVRLDLLNLVADRPLTANEIAERKGLSLDRCERFLIAATALGLLSRRNSGRFGLGMQGAALRANPGVAAMIEHHAVLYSDLQDPVALLRDGRRGSALSAYWAYAGANAPSQLDGSATSAYTSLMSASQGLIATDIIEAYPLRRHRMLLDVGGGDGTFLAAVAQQAPHLDLVLFDLPAVVERARIRLSETPQARRVAVMGGSFLDDQLPQGFDLVSLVRVVLDHDDDTVLKILRAARRAITSSGTILIAEPLSGLRGIERTTDAYFNIYLMTMGKGRARSVEEIARLLHAAGFVDVRQVWTRRPMLTGLIAARAS